MIKLVFCLRRRSEMSQAEFQRYWRDIHAPLVREAADALNIRRYVQSHTIHDPRIMPAVDARDTGMEPFDGIAEIWWTDTDAIVAASNTKVGRAAGRKLLADEANFIDPAGSTLFYVEEIDMLAE